MSVYYIHFRTTSGALIVDREGTDHTGDEPAIEEAAAAAAEMMRGSHPLIGGAFEIHDEGGWFVERVPVWRH